jgi:hypothetical protein
MAEVKEGEVEVAGYVGPRIAHIKATVVGKHATYCEFIESSTDLPPDPIGEVVVEAMQKAWKAGEDPTKCVVLLQFS